jgi:hypothetical protein
MGGSKSFLSLQLEVLDPFVFGSSPETEIALIHLYAWDWVVDMSSHLAFTLLLLTKDNDNVDIDSSTQTQYSSLSLV